MGDRDQGDRRAGRRRDSRRRGGADGRGGRRLCRRPGPRHPRGSRPGDRGLSAGCGDARRRRARPGRPRRPRLCHPRRRQGARPGGAAPSHRSVARRRDRGAAGRVGHRPAHRAGGGAALIYPARRAVVAAAALAPLALLIGVLVPQYWFAGLALLAFLLALGLADALLGAGARDAELICEGPAAVSVGAGFEVEAHVRFDRAPPSSCEVAVDSHPLLAAPGGYRRVVPLDAGLGFAGIEMVALRRGTAIIGRTWLRWPGMLGLVWKHK